MKIDFWNLQPLQNTHVRMLIAGMQYDVIIRVTRVIVINPWNTIIVYFTG